MRESYRRYGMLAAAVLVSLASGTNYVYSAYAPQLAKRLNITSTQTNLIGMAGNLGVYSGPVVGKIIDSRGPRLPLLAATGCQFFGYFGIRLFYNGTLAFRSATDTSISTLDIMVMAICMFATGLGGSAGLGSAVNSVAKSFPDSSRATAVGITLSGFGLSAFLFSTISRVLFPGDVSSFLLILALGTSIPMFLGSFVVKPVRSAGSGAGVGLGVQECENQPRLSGMGEYEPLTRYPEDEDLEVFDDVDSLDADVDIETGAAEAGVPAILVRTASYSSHQAKNSEIAEGSSRSSSQSPSDRKSLSESHELTLTRSSSREEEHVHFNNDPQEDDARAKFTMLGSTNRSTSVATMASLKSLGAEHVDIHGKELFSSADFWFLVGVLAMLSGTGLMYINNVGSVVLSLANKGAPADFDPIEVAKLQAAQVSIISIYNCLGRIVMGFVSDIFKNRFRVKRVWFCCVTSIFFVISQLAAQSATNVNNLWHVSALLGFAYGNIFGLLPVVTLEFWGLAHFSQNWGYLSISPAFGGNLANFLFGTVYDHHVMSSTAESGAKKSSSSISVPRGGSIPDANDQSHTCLVGQACYVTAFRFTTAGCIIALVLSLIVSIRRERLSRQRRRQARLEARWRNSSPRLEGEESRRSIID